MTRILRRIVLACLVLAVSPRAHARVEGAGPLTGCPAGTYRFLVNGDSRLRQVDLADGNVALVPGCRATKAQLTVEEHGSTVVAEWPSCAGMSEHVKLEGRIHGASCEQFDGTLQAGKDKPRTVHADLVACRVRYPDERERKAAVARAVDACLAELHGDPWKDAQDFGRLFFAVQAKLGCALGP
jgi:hypothetical protein